MQTRNEAFDRRSITQKIAVRFQIGRYTERALISLPAVLASNFKMIADSARDHQDCGPRRCKRSAAM